MEHWTWQVMCGNGCLIGMMRAIILVRLRTTPLAQQTVIIAYCEAVLGMMEHGSSALPTDIGINLTSRATAMVFDAPVNLHSEAKE